MLYITSSTILPQSKIQSMCKCNLLGEQSLFWIPIISPLCIYSSKATPMPLIVITGNITECVFKVPCLGQDSTISMETSRVRSWVNSYPSGTRRKRQRFFLALAQQQYSAPHAGEKRTKLLARFPSFILHQLFIDLQGESLKIQLRIIMQGVV